MIIHLDLNEDHLKLIQCIRIQDVDDDFLSVDKEAFLIMQSHLLDDVSIILGVRDQALTSTLEDAEGLALPDDVEKRCVDTYNYVKDNLFYIMQLVIQYACKGGLTTGKYKANDTDLIFEKEA